MYASVKETKERLYEFLGMLDDGEENRIIITRKGRPVAKITEYYDFDDQEDACRIGIAKGKFTVPDDFDADDEEIAKMFGA